MRSTEYKALQDADQATQNMFQYHIISGDFASILVRNNPPEDSNVTIYDAADTHHTDSDFSLYQTLSHYLTDPQFSNPSRETWLSVASHAMANFTADSAQVVHSPMIINEHVTVRTAHTGSLPHYGMTSASPLYWTADMKLDLPRDSVPVSQLTDFQPFVTVPDETVYTIQDISGTYYVLFSIVLTYPLASGDQVTGPIQYTYHGTDSNGNALLRFGQQSVDLTIGTRIRIPGETYGTYTLPTALVEDDIGIYSQNVDSGYAHMYNFIVNPVDTAWHSNRRTISTDHAPQAGFRYRIRNKLASSRLLTIAPDGINDVAMVMHEDSDAAQGDLVLWDVEAHPDGLRFKHVASGSYLGDGNVREYGNTGDYGVYETPLDTNISWLVSASPLDSDYMELSQGSPTEHLYFHNLDQFFTESGATDAFGTGDPCSLFPTHGENGSGWKFEAVMVTPTNTLIA